MAHTAVSRLTVTLTPRQDRSFSWASPLSEDRDVEASLLRAVRVIAGKSRESREMCALRKERSVATAEREDGEQPHVALCVAGRMPAEDSLVARS